MCSFGYIITAKPRLKGMYDKVCISLVIVYFMYILQVFNWLYNYCQTQIKKYVIL